MTSVPSGAVIRIPRRGRAPASTALSTPRRSRIRLASGDRDSPQTLARGKRARSKSVTLWPRRARRIAVAAPAGPAPTTTTSVLAVVPDIHSDDAEGDGVMPGDPGDAGGGGEAPELAAGVGPTDGKRTIVAG